MLFRDSRDQRAFDENGFLVVDLLDETAVKRLLDLYRDTVADVPQVDLFESSRHSPLELNMQIMVGLREVIAAPVSKLFAGGTLFGGTFMVKVPQNSNVLPLHQDWSIVEEDRFQSAFIWCALVDVTPERGSLFVLPGSHRYFNNIRSGNMPSVRIPLKGPIEEMVVDLPLRPGQAVIYSDQLFHGSYANRTKEPRIVCTGRVNEEGSSLVFYHRTGEDEVAVVAASPEFYLDKIDYLARGELPEGSQVLKTVKHHYLAVTEDVLLSRLAELGRLADRPPA